MVCAHPACEEPPVHVLRFHFPPPMRDFVWPPGEFDIRTCAEHRGWADEQLPEVIAKIKARIRGEA